MDPSLLMLLPKGIVTNTNDIYDEVASYHVVPPNKVYEYWHVYTTTNKKLKDPTARRLENFWWHVWGSDRRALSGRALARIFEDISVGPTFVPLRGPANRWEGPDAPPLTVEMILAHLKARPLSRPPQDNTLPAATKGNSDVSSATSSTCSRPTRPPSILKKHRAPPSPKLRPIARVISPHESADEGDGESEIPSSGSTIATRLDDSITHIRYGNVLPRSESQIMAPFSSNVKPSAVITSAVTAAPNAGIDENSSHALNEAHSTNGNLRNPGGQESTTLASAKSGTEQRQHVSRPKETPNDNTRGRISGMAANSNSAETSSPAVGRVVRQNNVRQTSSGHQRPGNLSASIKPNQARATEATASTTKVAAQGTIIEQSGNTDTSFDYTTTGFVSSSLSDTHSGPSSSSLLEPRLTPTQPSDSASLPLGRTKSQLTLLLEREKERTRTKSHTTH